MPKSRWKQPGFFLPGLASSLTRYFFDSYATSAMCSDGGSLGDSTLSWCQVSGPRASRSL